MKKVESVLLPSLAVLGCMRNCANHTTVAQKAAIELLDMVLVSLVVGVGW